MQLSWAVSKLDRRYARVACPVNAERQFFQSVLTGVLLVLFVVVYLNAEERSSRYFLGLQYLNKGDAVASRQDGRRRNVPCWKRLEWSGEM